MEYANAGVLLTRSRYGKDLHQDFPSERPPTFTTDENLKHADLPWKYAEGRWAVFSQLSSSG